MNEQEVLEMSPGEELNRLVAEEVMGHVTINDATFGPMERLAWEGEAVWSFVIEYSQDMSAAELVVDRLMELGIEDVTCFADFNQGGYTQAEAICKNALLTLRETRENGK